MSSVTAFEARDLHSLRLPSKTIAYFVFVLYFLCAIGEVLNVQWTDPNLPTIHGSLNKTSAQTAGKPLGSRAILVVAALRAGYKDAPHVFNGFMIFSALSASNTALYVASRSLYGMTRTINPWTWLSKLKILGNVWHKTGVPMWALFASFLGFLWLPFLQLRREYAISDVSQSECP